ncbi:MAG: hypothetical protein QME57_01140 [Patescibacteria group bacterium]|nr:hypothetical protein [Patescibacteria group bacterium]
MKLMLEDKDIQKLSKELATKRDLEKFATKEDLKQTLSEHIVKEMEIFTTKEDLEKFVIKEEFRKAMSDLQSSINGYAKKVDTYAQETIMLVHKVDRHEK